MDRSSCSHRSGKALLAVSGFVGALLPILNLVLAILMILTFLSGKTCDSVRDDSLLSQIIDNPANFDNEYILASAILNNGSIRLGVVDVLDSCRANQGIWSALRLDDNQIDGFPDIDNLTRIDINVTAELSGINLFDINIFPSDIVSVLDDFITVNISTIDLGFLENTDIDALTADVGLQGFEANFTAVNASLSQWFDDHGANAAVSQLQTDALALLNDTRLLLAQVEAVSNLFKSASAVAQDTIGSNDAIVAEIEDVKTGITAFQAFFQETAEDLIDIEAIANEVTELIDRFVDLVSDTLRTEVGPCRLLSAAYDDLTSSACEDGQESLDAYWFAIAIMTLAGFVLIIASFKLSRYLLHFEFSFEMYAEEEPKDAEYPMDNLAPQKDEKRFAGEPDLPGYEEATQDGGRRRSWYAENPALASPASKTMDEARL